MKRFGAYLSVLAVLAPLYGTARAEPGVTRDMIAFGQIAGFQGQSAPMSREIQRGILAAFEEANRAGGVKGRRLRLISEDDAYEPAKTIEVAKRMAGSGSIFAFIGAFGTAASAVIVPIASEAGIPLVAPFSGAEFLYRPFNPVIVNTRPSFADEMDMLTGKLLKERGISRLALLYQDDAMGQVLSAGVRRALTKAGLELVAGAPFERNTLAIKSAMLKIERGRPDAVILAGGAKACAEFVRLARELKLGAVLAMGSYAGGNVLLEELGPAGAGVIVSNSVPNPQDSGFPAGLQFQAALKALEPSAKPGFLSFDAYLGARLAIAALEKEDGEPTRKEFLKTVFSNSFDIGGIAYRFGPDSNQGSQAVYFSIVQADGTYKMVSNLNEAR